MNICGGAFIFSLCKAVFCEQMFLPKKGGGTLNFESGRWFQNSAAAEIFLRKGKAHKNPRRHGCSARKAIQKENLFYGSQKGERKGKTVMSIAPNKTYYIRSALSLSKRLNLYSSGSASDGMNVVLYSDDNSNEQKWYFDGDRLRPKTDTSFCLDRYTASAYLNNADIWKASASDAAAQLVDILPTDNYYFIRLRTPVNGKYYFLTAYNNANGGGGKGDKAENSDGNVYWHTYLGDGNRKQYWSFEECSGSSSGGAGEIDDIAVGSVVTAFPNDAYYSSNNASYALGTKYVGECTWYCNGRAYERKGIGNVCTKGADKWYTSAGGFSKLSSSETPVANSIACFDGGHVVYVEKVSVENGTTYIYFSECNWYPKSSPYLSNGQIEPPPAGTDGELKKFTLSKFTGRGPGSYQGCIVL